MTDTQPEVWLRGPVADVPALLQPVAHALLQAVEEVEGLMQGFPDEQLWTRPGGVAAAGFHLQHLGGVVDRLFTYVRAEPLSSAQLEALRREGKPAETGGSASELVAAFRQQVERALDQLRATDPVTLTEPRPVGRKQLPSTVLGLLFHAAEHVQRHVGQLHVTVRVQRDHRER